MIRSATYSSPARDPAKPAKTRTTSPQPSHTPTSGRQLAAIDGKGAFGRFRRILDRHDDLWPAWNNSSAEARLGRARAWLNDAGYDVLKAAG